MLYSTCIAPVVAHCLQVADYEVLLRRVMRRAPNAALLSFGIFSFGSTAVAPKARGATPGAAQDAPNNDLPVPFYHSGASNVSKHLE